jgi:hypothetical protein
MPVAGIISATHLAERLGNITPAPLSANMADQLVSPMFRSRRLSLTDILLNSLKVRLPYTTWAE